MLFVIRPNPRKAEAMDFVAPLGEMIEACGAKYVVYTAADCIPDDMLDKADCVVVLGGDGTILRAARDIFPRQIPLLGINFGHLGYLAQVGPEEALQALRMWLQVSIRSKRELFWREIFLAKEIFWQ